MSNARRIRPIIRGRGISPEKNDPDEDCAGAGRAGWTGACVEEGCPDDTGGCVVPVPVEEVVPVTGAVPVELCVVPCAVPCVVP